MKVKVRKINNVEAYCKLSGNFPEFKSQVETIIVCLTEKITRLEKLLGQK